MAYLGYLNDEDINVARGKIRATTIRNIFGHNFTLNDTEFVAVWENSSPYVFPTANLVMGIVSANTQDTAVTIRIIGLDSNYVEVTENVTLNGTTELFTSNTFFRINDVVTIAGNANGAITVANSGTTYAAIRAGEGRNQASIYTVPHGCQFYLYRIDAFATDAGGGNSGKAEFRNFVTLSTGVEIRIGQSTFTNNLSINRRFPFKYDQHTDIQMQMKTVAGTHPLSVFAEGLLINTQHNGLR